MQENRNGENAVDIKVIILRIIVYVVMGLTVVAAISVPKFIGDYLLVLYNIFDDAVVLKLSLFTWICMLPFLAALWFVKRICDIIAQGNPFSQATRDQLSHIVNCCYIEAGINIVSYFVFRFVFDFSLFTGCFVITAICGVIAIFATVLKELVKSAIRIREENEFTI